MLIRLFRWLRGYLLIKMKGQSPERFINLCSNRYIYIWNLNNVDGNYECNIMLKDYLKLKPIAKKTGTMPLIKHKYGLPFLVHRYKKRKGYITGIILFCMILYILSLFIWDIDIQGGHSYTPEAMIKFLKTNQVYAGLQKSKIDCQEIEDLIRGSYKDIGWVSAEVKGTRLILKITETNMPSPAVIATEPCHIIASKNCIITKMITRTGKPLVKIGDVVKKGDILVSGVVDIMGDFDTVISKNAVIADADIIGKTYYEYKDIFSLNYIEKKYTGNYKTGISIRAFLKKFNLYNPRIPYTKYDIMMDDFMLHFSDSFYLPIEYNKTCYLEYQELKQKYTEEEAKAKAKEKLKLYFDELVEKDVLILEKDVKIIVDTKTCTTQGKIIVLESVKDYKPVDDSEWRIIDTDEPDGNDN